MELPQQIQTAADGQTLKPARPRSESPAATKLREIERLTQLTEILELMEETHKDKNWILERIRANHLKIPELKPTMGAVSILKVCPQNFISHLLGLLKFSEIDVFEGPPPLTTTYHWFFTDIVASSDPTITTNEQARKIIVLNKLIERTEVFRQRDPDSTLILPTGDGMAIGFSDSPEKPLILALELHKDLNRYNTQKSKEKDRLYLRIGLDSGPVYIITDLNGKENVWGPGIIMARRVMDLARDMNIIASSKIANDIRDVTDPSNMMTHHHMNWNLVNISDQPVDRIFYYLDGDVPRNFPDMKVVVKDEEGQDLEMISLNVNKPYHKEFYIRLRKPLKPKQKGRWVNLEYDWEEPDRHYFYRCASNCKKFSYSLTVPKSLQINQKVVYVDVESGEKRYAKIPATVKYLENKTQINWEGTNLAAHDAYRFDW